MSDQSESRESHWMTLHKVNEKKEESSYPICQLYESLHDLLFTSEWLFVIWMTTTALKAKVDQLGQIQKKKTVSAQN